MLNLKEAIIPISKHWTIIINVQLGNLIWADPDYICIDNLKAVL